MVKNLKTYFLSFCLFGLSFGQVDYGSEIQPILNDRCTNCHGNSGGLNLSSYTNVMSGGISGAVITPYDHTTSELYNRITLSESSDFDMPPAGSLDQIEIDLIAQWIDEGALEVPGSSSGCTDPEAYSCADDDEWENYIFDVGGVMYDNSCNWDWNTSTWEAEYVGGCESESCEGYYNPDATSDDGSCRYYQAPHDDEVYMDVIDESTIYIDWTEFAPPSNSVVESYHVLRCTEGCSWIPDFTPADQNTTMLFYDNFEWESGVTLKYAISVKYENNPYWGWAIGASYITPCNLGDLNGDGGYNILDIVTLANCILAGNCADLENSCAGDLNGDGGYNVLDIVSLANCVLANNCG